MFSTLMILSPEQGKLQGHRTEQSYYRHFAGLRLPAFVVPGLRRGLAAAQGLFARLPDLRRPAINPAH